MGDELDDLEITVPVLDREIVVPGVNSSRFGHLPAPKTLPELWQLIAFATEGGRQVEGWRGQANLSWALDSSAVRRIKEHGPLPPELLRGIGRAGLDEGPVDPDSPALPEYYVQQYESYLLNEARLAGHGFYAGRTLSDLELLAVLQHYGAATRLLDFSRNVAVALWFACSSHPEEYGLLAAIDTRKTRQLTSVSDTSKPIRELVLFQNYSWTFSWQPQHLFERMRVQQSFFLFSRVENHEWGSLSLPELGQKENGLFLVAISPNLKSDAARMWQQRMFGFSGLSLFPDLEGFSRFQSSGSPYLSIG
jgi:hypothetical protein